MEQEIIDNLKLKATDIYNGVGFVNDITTYDYQELVYISEGDIHGYPLQDNTVMVFNAFGFFRVSKELLKDPEGRKYLDQRIMRELNLKP